MFGFDSNDVCYAEHEVKLLLIEPRGLLNIGHEAAIAQPGRPAHFKLNLLSAQAVPVAAGGEWAGALHCPCHDVEPGGAGRWYTELLG